MTRRAAWLLLVAMLLSACGVVKVKKPPQRAPRGPMKAFTFEAGNPGETPAGWKVGTFSGPGAETPGSKLVLTDKQKRSGDMSAELRPNKGTRGGGNGRICGHSPSPGQPLRVTAYLKTSAKEVATLMVSIMGQNASPFLTLAKPAPKWTKFEGLIVPDTPHPAKGVLELCISFTAQGPPVWIDDVKIAKAQLPASPGPNVQPVPLENLDMERFDRRGNLDIWVAATDTEKGTLAPGYGLRADRTQKRSGVSSLLMSATDVEDTRSNSRAEYCFDAAPFVGKAIRAVGWVKADVGEDGGGRFGLISWPLTSDEIKSLPYPEVVKRGEMYNSQTSIFRSIDWTKFELVGPVARSTKQLCFEFSVYNAGSAWLDDVTVEVIEL